MLIPQAGFLATADSSFDVGALGAFVQILSLQLRCCSFAAAVLRSLLLEAVAYYFCLLLQIGEAIEFAVALVALGC